MSSFVAGLVLGTVLGFASANLVNMESNDGKAYDKLRETIERHVK